MTATQQSSRSILIADPDVDTVRELRRVLKDDYEVILVKDGSKALEQSILKQPDLVLFDRHCPLIGATQFVRIIRANPRTEDIPIILISDVPLGAASLPGFLQGVLVKPLNLDEVRAHVAAVMRKVDAVKQVGGEDGAVSGSLDQISMPDLLQIFSLNRRSGCLQLTGPDKRSAEVFVHDGRIEEAACGDARGEKALYRVLGWRGGRFAFIPTRRSPTVSLASSTDSLLMEGMRQSDELERIVPEMPSGSARLERLVPVESLPEGLHPITAEILGLLEYYPRLGDLVDKAKATDLEVYLALRSLFSAGILRAVEAGAALVQPALLSQEEIVELRARLKRAGLAPTYLGSPKVAVLARDVGSLKPLSSALMRLYGFVAADLERLHRLGVGPIGTLQLDAHLGVEIFAVSSDERLLPLAFSLSAGTVAGMVLGRDTLGSMGRAVHLLEEERRATLIVVRAPAEPELEPQPRRLDLALPGLDEESVRLLVHRVLTQAAGREDLRGGTL